MNKFGAIAIVIAVVIICYVIMIVVMPVVASFISTANATVTAQSNWLNYPGSQGFFLATPWILFFVPGAIGMIIIVVILRQP